MGRSYSGLIALALLLQSCDDPSNTLPTFPLKVFPEPYQGPKDISGSCWRSSDLDRLAGPESPRVSWRMVHERISTELNAIGLKSTVWQYDNGFVVVSDFQQIDDRGEVTDKKTPDERQFVFVLAPDTIPTNQAPTNKEQFTYYYKHGAAALPDDIADKTVQTDQRHGDHLWLLVYRFNRRPLSRDLTPVEETKKIEHFEVSGLAAHFKAAMEASEK